MLMGEEIIVILPLIIIVSLLIHKAKMSHNFYDYNCTSIWCDPSSHL